MSLDDRRDLAKTSLETVGLGHRLGHVITQLSGGERQGVAIALVPLVAIVGGLAAALAIGAVAGLYPALRAARLSPTETLRV